MHSAFLAPVAHGRLPGLRGTSQTEREPGIRSISLLRLAPPCPGDLEEIEEIRGATQSHRKRIYLIRKWRPRCIFEISLSQPR
jgi:hypothetical protein